MKKLVLTALVLLTASIQAQETGNAAVTSSDAGAGNNWDNWVFAGGSLAAAATGLIVLFVTGANGPNVGDPVTPVVH